MDKAKRTSKEIDTELQAERETIKKLQRELDTTKKEQATAEGQQERLAYKALAEGDKGAQKKLDEAEERLAKAERHVKSFEKAIAQGMQRFEALEHEWKAALRAEEWAAILALAAEAQREAEQIDGHMDALSTFLGGHQGKLEELKRRSHNLGIERAFGTTGVRHAFRRLNWLLIKSGASGEVEKPSEVYRQTTYSAILAQQVESAKKIAETQPNGQDGEIQPEEPEAGTEAEVQSEAQGAAGAQAQV